jgi:hypothetical protein
MNKFEFSRIINNQIRVKSDFKDCFSIIPGMITNKELNSIKYAPEMYNLLTIIIENKSDSNYILEITELLNKINDSKQL